MFDYEKILYDALIVTAEQSSAAVRVSDFNST